MNDNNKVLLQLQRLRVKLKVFLSQFVSADDVEDIVQDAYVKVWQSHQEQASSPVTDGFVFTVAKNLALDYLRKPHVSRMQSVEETDDAHFASGDTTYHGVKAQQQFLHFCESVKQLPPQCRKIFVLKKVYGLKAREIATELGISTRTVEVQLQRAYVKFYQSVEQQRTEVGKCQDVSREKGKSSGK
ncbi:sigma-70 family RNA polymerase sigma factor [Aestuariibacter sp. GS-14]|uniref:RNA polymerase sigma factor n=1 Tax=Aestuariibacter sp. GS-14 TaxID=2590670 RepID=UPI001128E30B|nr:sigma-70 family RNA polymerase sigma factor [Aestuariibacter sp. GS-14]TPV58535.1 sigma-70 family RNA polymerase sigma factor [Aestuariibacter sp. GS-14]